MSDRLRVHGCKATVLEYHGPFVRVLLDGGGTMSTFPKKMREWDLG